MSPFGIDKKLGGDSPENIKWMEECKKKFIAQGKPESNAIAICKAQMKKSRASLDDEIVLDYDLVNKVELVYNRAIQVLMRKGNTYNEASALAGAYLVQCDYDFEVFGLKIASL